MASGTLPEGAHSAFFAPSSLCLGGDGLWVYEFCKLALERLDRTAAPALRDGLRHGIREYFLFPFLHSVENRSRDGLRRCLRYVQGAGHICVHGARQDNMYA